MKKLFSYLKLFLDKILVVRSLRFRIFGLVVLVGFFPSIFMRYAIVNTYESRAVEQRASAIQNQLLVVGNHLISNDYLAYGTEVKKPTNTGVINAELDMLSNLYEGRVMIIAENCRIIKDTYGISEGKTIISEEVMKCFKGENIIHYDDEHGYIEMTTPIVDSRVIEEQEGQKIGDRIVGVMLTSVSDSTIVATMEVLNQKAMVIQALTMVIVFALALVLSYVMTKPFNRITEEIKKVKAGFIEESISVPDYEETIHIVDAFNDMLARMKALDDSRQDFVANVSHELKTPMTSLKVLADSLVSQENVPVELYQEFMEDMVSEIDRENQIINDLLSLVKMDKSAQKLNIVPLNINELAELILKRMRPLARKRDVEIVFESNRAVIAEVDEVKISLVMSNLVENAIKYNKEHGSVKVVLDADHQYFTFEVTDTGIGIPEESMPHIYERFYRVDKSHSREIGGTGLGLAITKNAVLLHKGSITLTSTEGEGTTFLVKIPLSYIG